MSRAAVDTPGATRELSLLESLGEGWMKLPIAAMSKKCGPATQTLGGLFKITNRETFSPASEIASKARLPLPTVRKHLVTLDAGGWIENKGRQTTRRGWLRRTATIAITKQTIDGLAEFGYGILPWWAYQNVNLNWSSKAVLSIVMAKLAALKSAVDNDVGIGLDADDLIGSIENMGGVERFAFSLSRLAEETGLDHKSVTAAKRKLSELKIIKWYTGDKSHLLTPDWNFRVLITTTKPGWCTTRFGSRGVKSRRHENFFDDVPI